MDIGKRLYQLTTVDGALFCREVLLQRCYHHRGKLRRALGEDDPTARIDRSAATDEFLLSGRSH